MARDSPPIKGAALTQIAEEADLLEVDGRAWLLVPASGWLVDTLAAVNAASEDMEPHMDDEDTRDKEHDPSDLEPDTDAELWMDDGHGDLEGTPLGVINRDRTL